MNGSNQPWINNPSHYSGGFDDLTLVPVIGSVVLVENTWTTQVVVNTVNWTTGYAGFISCGNPGPHYSETSATAFRGFVVDGVVQSVQQPWTATSYNYYTDPSLPPDQGFCSEYSGSHYVNYDFIQVGSANVFFDLGQRGRVYVYVPGCVLQGQGPNGSVQSTTLRADFLLYNVPPAPECLPAFAAPASFAAGSAPAHVAVCDVNGDGKRDLITANYDGQNATYFLGNGDPAGTFGAALHFSTGGGFPQCIATGYFDADTAIDFVIGNGSGWVSTYSGHDGALFIGPVIATGGSARSIAVGDFNSDGEEDLAIASDGHTATVSIALGNGDCTFQAPVEYGSGSLSTSHTGVARGDFNHDGKLDLAVTNGSDTVSILLGGPTPGVPGNGDGTFSVGVNYAVGSVPVGLVAGYFDADLDLDLAVVNSGSSSVSILLGNPDGTFAAAVNMTVGSGAVAIAAGDLNGDGKQDLVTANYAGTNLSILVGFGDGSFYRLPSELALGAGVNADAVAVGDFNLDGRLDLVATNHSGNGVYTLQQLPLPPSPVITSQPSNVFTCLGNSVNFQVSSTSSTPRTYRWRKGGTPLSNGGRVSGATTASLILSGVLSTDNNATFDCIISNTCGSSTTNTATLTLCAPDFNCSGAISVQDIFDFLAAYFSHVPRSDFNASGVISVQDIFDFLAAYFAGC